MNITIPIIYSGFDKNHKVVAAKTIAEIHRVKLIVINASINKLIINNRLYKNIDYIDCVDNNLIGTNHAKKFFLLSESGYKILINSMNLIKSQVVKDFLSQYFDCHDCVDIKEHKRKEVIFFDFLDQLLKPINLHVHRQFNVMNYRLDGYIKELNLAIEYDENAHKHYTYSQQEGRQKEIEDILGCSFVRLNDFDTNEYNAGLIFKNIINSQLAVV